MTESFNEPSVFEPRRITILGATGSIGRSTLDLIERAPEKFQIVALTANSNAQLLAELALKFRPQLAVIADSANHQTLKDLLAGSGIETDAGPAAVVAAARLETDWTMAGIVGAAGLPPTLAAVEQGRIVAFANKECLVCAGPLMLAHVKKFGATLLPVDSEHNAIFQVFDQDRPEGIRRLILTASGGPFRNKDRAYMANVTAAEAVKHPNWSMGAKISVDSATMMNKGLELIEAHFLFNMPQDQIDITIHPQSVIHSMVEYADGSVLAQMGSPDMRTPIAYSLAWPARMETPCKRLDFAAMGDLTFQAPDPIRFPALRLAREALAEGGLTPAVLNAANEVAVAAFLEGRIGFLDIERVVEETMTRFGSQALTTLDHLFDVDLEARQIAKTYLIRGEKAA